MHPWPPGLERTYLGVDEELYIYTPAQMEHMHQRISGSRLNEEREHYMQVMNDWFDETEAA
jgi:hypothetical protein